LVILGSITLALEVSVVGETDSHDPGFCSESVLHMQVVYASPGKAPESKPRAAFVMEVPSPEVVEQSLGCCSGG